ncbi:MAG: enoyl-CoA hydratase-related protein [Pseudonocardiaceae bacterium]
MTAVAKLVHLAVRSGIATITLDSPANRNALSPQLRAELLDALQRSSQDRSVRVVILDHTGPAFCAGMDLREARQESEQGVGEFRRILEQIYTSPKPVVAKVAGAARAGGIGMVAAADVAVATNDATFAFTEVRIGLVPAVISVTVLPRLLPHAAHELFLTGETFDATRAVTIGLLNSAVPADQLAAEVARYTDMLSTGAPEALTLTKQMLHRNHASAMAEHFTAMLELSAQRFASEEGQEGIRAFAEKRPPSWIPRP